MYLSRAFINPRRRGASAFLGAPQRLHAAVLQAFPREAPTRGEEGPRVLWRLDSDDWRRPVLWIVSPSRPDLSHIVEPYGWPAADHPFETRDYSPLLRRLDKGQRYVFRTTVNPVVSQWTRGQRGKLSALHNPPEQVQWFQQRAPKWGFDLLPSSAPVPQVEGEPLPSAWAVEIRANTTLRFHKKAGSSGEDAKTGSRQASGRSVALRTVALEGLLEVVDPEALRRSLTHGIGRARGYGCGLITLAPAR